MAALEVEQGHPGRLHLAQLSPPKAEEEDWRIFPSKPYHEYLEWDLAASVAALEEELSRQARGLDLRDGSGERAVLVGIDRGEGVQAEVDLAELAELARTAGAVVAHKELVFRPSLDPRYAVGRGKVEELVSHAYHQNAGTLIFGIDLSAAQARELEAITGLKVLDRTQLILDIFAQHARTPEAKVQVSPAQLKYLLPRLVGKGKDLSRLGVALAPGGRGDQARGGPPPPARPHRRAHPQATRNCRAAPGNPPPARQIGPAHRGGGGLHQRRQDHPDAGPG